MDLCVADVVAAGTSAGARPPGCPSLSLTDGQGIRRRRGPYSNTYTDDDPYTRASARDQDAT